MTSGMPLETFSTFNKFWNNIYTHVVTGRCPGWVGNFPLSLDNSRSPHMYINQRLQIQFAAPDDERCAARNMLSLQ